MSNFSAHCLVVAGLPRVNMKLNKILAKREHSHGVAGICSIQTCALDCAFNLQWTVMREAAVIFGQQAWKLFDVASNCAVLVKLFDEIHFNTL